MDYNHMDAIGNMDEITFMGECCPSSISLNLIHIASNIIIYVISFINDLSSIHAIIFHSSMCSIATFVVYGLFHWYELQCPLEIRI